MPSQRKPDLLPMNNEKPQRGSARDRDLRSNAKKRRKSSTLGLSKEAVNSDTAENIVPLTPWEAFQEHLRLIDDNTGMYPTRDAAPRKEQDDQEKTVVPAEPAVPNVEQQAKQLAASIKGRSSDTFSKVMYEFQLKKQQHAEKMAAIQREKERRAQEEMTSGEPATVAEESEPEEDDFDPDWSDDEDTNPVQDAAAIELHKSALRAWAIIRRHIQEIKMEKKNVGSTMNWNFLRQTLGNMTDMEKGRQNLYEKYLDKPDAWKEGFVNFPQELFDKEKIKPGRRGYVLPVTMNRKSQKHKSGAQTNRSKSVASH